MKRLLVLLPLLVLLACEPTPDTEAPVREVPEAFLALADSATLRPIIQELSDDRYEGRGTGTPGEALTIAYIAEHMRMYGLEGGAPDGSFFQRVPMLGATPTDLGTLVFRADAGAEAALAFTDAFIARTELDATDAALDNVPLVFVGYGIHAPESGWDDYAGVDVTDKVVIAFVNDPPATEAEPNRFQGDTLTYFGRWTYKYEEARRQGAKGAFLIHTTETAGYPFQVLSGSASGEQVQLATLPDNPLVLRGWITEDSAARLAEMAGTSLSTWFEQAAEPTFAPQELPITASLAMAFETRRFEGTNVIGKLAGTSDEAIIYTAHHDHLGIGVPDATGDAIYNGAEDNATGTAMVLAAARAFGQGLDAPPQRTIYFATVTAEEKGLLGSKYLAEHPPVPADDLIANINLDGGNVYGATEDIVGLGAEKSELRGLFADAAADEGLRVIPDAAPNQGYFFRSDQLSFAREGVPGVFLNPGTTYVGRPADYATTVGDDYNANRYHQPSDEFDPAWPMAGLVQQTRVALRLGYRLAMSSLRPAWNDGEAFAQARSR